MFRTHVPLRRWRTLCVAAVLGATASFGVAAQGIAAGPAGFVDFQRDAQPLLAKYCIRCHGGDQPQAELRLDRYKTDHDVLADFKVWNRVLEQLESEQMPPDDEPRPAADERTRLLDALRRQTQRVVCGPAVDPGRVTLRRLNRNEYDNTIRDLTGVDFHPAEDFPADDVGYGFDNIGDVLTLPPILFEKYLAAAEQVVDRAIVVPADVPTQYVTYRQAALKRRGHEKERVPNGQRLRFLSEEGELYVAHRFPAAGRYRLRLRAAGDQAGPEPVRVAVRIDGREVKRLDVPAQAAKPEEYVMALDLKPGVREIAVAFVNDYYDPKAEKSADRDRNFAFESLKVEGPVAPAYDELPESHRRIVFTKPYKSESGKSKSKQQAAREVVERFASRAWRRPVRGDESDRLLELFARLDAEGKSFEGAIRGVCAAILTSPNFLFRVEEDRPPVDESGAYPIGEFELASRLSYFLWSSMPDEELFRLARDGKLRASLDRQLARMAADAKAEAFVRNFSGQWLQTRNLDVVAVDRKTFPTWTPQLRDDLRRETEAFFAAVLREDRSVLDFIDADYAFVNERLAGHYGLPPVRGDQFRRVSLKDGSRGGVLAMGSVLVVTSNPTRTSPVKRGKFILENILGTPPPPPPPGAGDLKDDEQAITAASLRERMELHRRDPGCASCHNRMDPLGFGFENFDAVGRWRTRDGRFDVDASGVLPSGESFRGPAELKKILLKGKDDFARCLTEKMLTYALGRGLEYYDHCATEEIAAALAANDYKFSTLLRGVVHSRPFLMRRAAAGASQP